MRGCESAAAAGGDEEFHAAFEVPKPIHPYTHTPIHPYIAPCSPPLSFLLFFLQQALAV